VTSRNYDCIASLEERKEQEASCVWNFTLSEDVKGKVRPITGLEDPEGE
jgi:hypothetical protein